LKIHKQNFINKMEEQSMKCLENQILKILQELQQNHNIHSVRAEFESEGARLEEVLRLRHIAQQANLPLTLKIGGCEAIRDLYDARDLNAVAIIAPMIETAYAMQKYVQATHKIFSQDEWNNTQFYINIETKTSIQNLPEILQSPYFIDVTGIVIGRVDLVTSLGKTRQEIDSPEIQAMNKNIALQLPVNKELAIGGGITEKSLPFLKTIPKLSRTETRKIVFHHVPTPEALHKASQFELLWLQYKQNHYITLSQEDAQRIQLLEQRLQINH